MRRLIAVASVVVLGACSWLPNHHLDYRKAESIKPMVVPEGMVFIGEKALYPVPDGLPAPVYSHAKKDDIPPPPQLAVTAQESEDTAQEAAPDTDPTNTRVVLARDGSGYPIIMMHTPFSWAWEYVGQALAATDMKIEDRDRESGIYYVRTPKELDVEGREAQIKLSLTANGIQIAVLDRKGAALLDKEPGQQIIQRLYDAL
ncbi:MAG: outer membrane protein assembly factor BamC [Alcanivoracaceae bacterium]|jgi:outer membrane protein assembly factor BamC|nr:outer membrane protein assembly factor BamC [Alcanivoracaceae bacterium]